ncbi:MAG: 3-hydroxybutyryl-CoA dehydrogenase [Chloroflexi bacterium]|nr:3-hydroxybutyryl-CoA dehydrogenase [Chloroflexota bacterium]
MNISINGDPLVCEMFEQLCRRAGHTTDPSLPLDASLDLTLTDKAAKQTLLQQTAAPLILTAAVPCSATEDASWAAHPEHVTGISPIFGDTVELAPALQTDEATLARARAFLQSLGVTVMQVADGPGLVRMRVLCCLVNEAASALADGIASAADIDTAMKLGANYPRGPLQWADSLGLPVVLAVMRALHADYGEDRYRPHPLLVRKVLARQNFLA